MMSKFYRPTVVSFVLTVVGALLFVVSVSFGATLEIKFEDPADLDNFEAINDGTRAEKGDWQIKDGALQQYTDNVKEGGGPSGNDPATGGYFLLKLPGSTGWSDYVVSADFVWTDDDWWGIMFYYTDELNYYRYRVEQRDSVEKNQDPRYRLEKFVNGAYTELAGGDLAGVRIPDANPGKDNVVEPHNLKASAIGGTIEIFLDDNSITSVSDTDLSQGSVAFYMTTNTGWIDNLVITGETLTAVEPADKLTTTWAGIKAGL